MFAPNERARVEGQPEHREPDGNHHESPVHGDGHYDSSQMVIHKRVLSYLLVLPFSLSIQRNEFVYPRRRAGHWKFKAEK
jgi:hypothetical protein